MFYIYTEHSVHIHGLHSFFYQADNTVLDWRPVEIFYRQIFHPCLHQSCHENPLLAFAFNVFRCVVAWGSKYVRACQATDFLIWCLLLPNHLTSLNVITQAPEVFSRDYSCSSDVWSAGVLLYQLFTGGTFPFWRVPGCAKVSKLDEVANAVTNNEITYNFGPFTSMSEEGLDFMQRCLSRSEKERLTVNEALSHPWLTMVDADEPYMKLVSNHGSGNNILPSPLGMDRRASATTAATAAAAAQ